MVINTAASKGAQAMAEDAVPSDRVSQIEITRNAEIHLELDDEKIEAIRACLAKGRLSIRISNVDLGQVGRFDAPYLYD
jgi:hypothetical protein